MTNNLVLPLLALILAILAAIFPLQREDQPPPVLHQRIREIRAGSILTAIVLLLFAGAATVWPATFKTGGPMALALAIGGLVGVFSSVADVARGGFVVGMAVVGAAALHLLPPDGVDKFQIAYVAGVFIAAFATDGMRPKLSGGYLAVLAALVVVAVDFLGRFAVPGSDPAAASGVALGIAFLVSALGAGLIARFSKSDALRIGIGLAVLLGVGYLACRSYLNAPELGNLWLGGIAVGGIVHLILAGESQPEPFRFVLSAVIWLGAATVAFGLKLGYGMAVTLLGGVGTLVLLGGTRGLMSISVAAAILAYRLFREIYPEDAQAPDIGQHYTMIGITIGALLPLLPIEWARAREITGWRTFASLAVWLLILTGLPIAASVLLGSKGAIGIVVGLSFSAIVEGLRGVISLAPVGLGAGMAAIGVLSYGWLGDWTDLERIVKVRAVVVVGTVALVLAAALFGLSRQAKQEAES